jgi:hypothetical protein
MIKNRVYYISLLIVKGMEAHPVCIVKLGIYYLNVIDFVEVKMFII